MALGQVRSLSLITHFNLMQLKYPGAVTEFYGELKPFIVFDVIPTDNLYEETFYFEDDEPYSESAEDIGYESRMLVINGGSFTIFVVYMVLKQLLICTANSFTKKDSKQNKYFVAKQKAFF